MGAESLAVATILNSEDLITLARDLQAFKWYYTACCTLLFYDYLLTWQKEYEYIWNWTSKGYIFFLFLLTRYIPIAFCVITLFAYFSPLWSMEICNRFARVEWIQTLLITIPAETVLLIRVNALVKRRFLAITLSGIMLTQCSVVIYAMSLHEENMGLTLPDIPVDEFHVCILYSEPKMDLAYLLCSIIFDTIVFLVTLAVTLTSGCNSLLPDLNDRINSDTGRKRRRRHARSRPTTSVLLSTIRRDGILYFCAILSGNVTWLILCLHARAGLKFMNAQPSMIITSIMINRLSLSLRKVSERTAIRGITENWSDWNWPRLEM
ncbi:hypothetical protein GYMLUDRAFT_34508 [Collybiopsis luxurians FD-317 M1]|nr:hypothetical protein GYMLUDRAFT_34508 [Collybiopsis luxurians FD-317 M1]